MPSEKWQCIRTNINVTKSFKDEMQKIVDLYREKQDRNIPIGKIVESLIHNDEYISLLLFIMKLRRSNYEYKRMKQSMRRKLEHLEDMITLLWKFKNH